MTPAWDRLSELAAAMPARPAFTSSSVVEFPPTVRRYLEASIADGTVLAPGVHLTMRGSIKIGRWLPFRARQLLVPSIGMVWQARVAGVITGSDRFVDGAGAMDWRLLGLFPVARADGADVSRSAAERAAGESVWAPTAVVRDGSLRDLGPNRVGVGLDVGGHHVELEHRLDAAGRIEASWFPRWGDPDRSGTWDVHPFGVEVIGTRAFAGTTIPHRGRVGWHYGTDRWEEGVFFRYEILDCQPLR